MVLGVSTRNDTQHQYLYVGWAGGLWTGHSHILLSNMRVVQLKGASLSIPKVSTCTWRSETVLVVILKVSTCLWNGLAAFAVAIPKVSTRYDTGRQYLGGIRSGFCQAQNSNRNFWRDSGGILSESVFLVRKSRRNHALIPLFECRIPGGIPKRITKM